MCKAKCFRNGLEPYSIAVLASAVLLLSLVMAESTDRSIAASKSIVQKPTPANEKTQKNNTKELEDAVKKAEAAYKQAVKKAKTIVNEAFKARNKAIVDYTDALKKATELKRNAYQAKLKAIQAKLTFTRKSTSGAKIKIDEAAKKKLDELEKKVVEARAGIISASKSWHNAVNARNEFIRKSMSMDKKTVVKKRKELDKAIDIAREKIGKANETYRAAVQRLFNARREAFSSKNTPK